jgi:hypothetical protein
MLTRILYIELRRGW